MGSYCYYSKKYKIVSLLQRLLVTKLWVIFTHRDIEMSPQQVALSRKQIGAEIPMVATEITQ